MLGRYDPMKGRDEFLKVAAHVRTRRPGVTALVVGIDSNQEARHLRRQATQLDIGPALVVVGQTREPWRGLNAMDVPVHTSLYGEGFPNVVAEAQACGVTVPAYDCGDVRYILPGPPTFHLHDIATLSSDVTAQLISERRRPPSSEPSEGPDTSRDQNGVAVLPLLALSC